MGQGRHFTPGFCHEAVVFWAAFSDARLAAAWSKRVKVTSDGQEHFIDKRGDCSRFILNPADGVAELAHGIQAAFNSTLLQ